MIHRPTDQDLAILAKKQAKVFNNVSTGAMPAELALIIIERAAEFNSLYFTIIDDPGVKTSDIIARLKFPVTIHDGCSVDQTFPPPREITTRYFFKGIEADLEHRGKSADDCQIGDLPCITLRERLLMEEMYFF